MINENQNERERDDKNEEGDDLAKELGNRRAPFSFPVTIPEVAIQEGDEESDAEKEKGGADMPAPIRLDAVERDCRVKRERKTEKLEENAELNAGPVFKQPAKGKRDEIGPDEQDHRDERFLVLE